MTITIQQALQLAQQKINSFTETPQLEAEILLAAVLQKPRTFLLTWPEQVLTAEQQQLFFSFLERRAQREPIAYILGQKEFWSLDLIVTRDTLIPRPETELLVELVLDLFPTQEKRQIADLGTGSGAIALAIAHERPDWHIFATDTSENALQIASKNAHQLGKKNVSFHQGNWCTALPSSGLDAIVSNPPYIAATEWERYAAQLEFEPHHALVAGDDGLDAIREICQTATLYLKPGGYLLVEHGFAQGEAVRELFVATGYKNVDSVRDLAGLERITQGQRQD